MRIENSLPWKLKESYLAQRQWGVEEYNWWFIVVVASKGSFKFAQVVGPFGAKRLKLAYRTNREKLEGFYLCLN